MPVPSTTIQNGPLPSGVDWASGLNGLLGTPFPANAIAVEGSQGETTIEDISTQELPTSPQLEIAEQGTCKHQFTCPYATALQYATIYSRGTLTVDSYGNYFRVLSNSVERQSANQAVFSTVSETLSFDTPPDEFSITPITLGIDIMKHPRYFNALMPTSQIPYYTGTQDTNSQTLAKMAIIRGLQAYRENPQVTPSNNLAYLSGNVADIVHASFISGQLVWSEHNPNYTTAFPATATPAIGTTWSGNPYPPTATATGNPNPQFFWNGTSAFVDTGNRVQLALAAAQELIGKLWLQEDTPEVVGWDIEWSQYTYIPPYLNPGGYVESPCQLNVFDSTAPVAVPPLPYYFTSTEWPPSGSTSIFDNIGLYNPQVYTQSGQQGSRTFLQCLREADTCVLQRTWFKTTRKWKITAIGQFDRDIYTQNSRPNGSNGFSFRPLLPPS